MYYSPRVENQTEKKNVICRCCWMGPCVVYVHANTFILLSFVACCFPVTNDSLPSINIYDIALPARMCFSNQWRSIFNIYNDFLRVPISIKVQYFLSFDIFSAKVSTILLFSKRKRSSSIYNNILRNNTKI